jgi:hypothetical protein
MGSQPHPTPAAKKTIPPAALGSDAAMRRVEPSAGLRSFEESRKPVGYGLPCIKCHLYYPADLDACPTCQSTERVAPVVAAVRPNISQAAAESVPDSDKIDQEREEFLRQFKSQLYTAHAEVTNTQAALCNLGEHHTGEPESAEVCKTCYERLQERVDVCEAALHMDLKDAAQIIYDAVWADPSDPSKTYRNAASALLAELRKRSGITTVLSPFQPLAHSPTLFGINTDGVI